MRAIGVMVSGLLLSLGCGESRSEGETQNDQRVIPRFHVDGGPVDEKGIFTLEQLPPAEPELEPDDECPAELGEIVACDGFSGLCGAGLAQEWCECGIGTFQCGETVGYYVEFADGSIQDFACASADDCPEGRQAATDVVNADCCPSPSAAEPTAGMQAPTPEPEPEPEPEQEPEPAGCVVSECPLGNMILEPCCMDNDLCGFDLLGECMEF